MHSVTSYIRKKRRLIVSGLNRTNFNFKSTLRFSVPNSPIPHPTHVVFKCPRYQFQICFLFQMSDWINLHRVTSPTAVSLPKWTLGTGQKRRTLNCRMHVAWSKSNPRRDICCVIIMSFWWCERVRCFHQPPTNRCCRSTTHRHVGFQLHRPQLFNNQFNVYCLSSSIPIYHEYIFS